MRTERASFHARLPLFTIVLPLSPGPSAFPNVTRVTAVLAHSLGELLLLGTEGGHVFIVEVPGFRELEERNISLDQVASRLAAHHTALHAEG